MSTPKKPTRPTKPKAPVTKPVTKDVVVTPVVQPVEQPVVQPVVQPENQPPVVEKKARIQTNKIIETSISAARTRRHLDKLGCNAHLDSLIAEIKVPINEHKAAKKQLETGKITVRVEQKTEKGKTRMVDEVRDLTEEQRAAAVETINRIEASLPELESKKNALSREKTRFSDEAAVALSIICNEVILELTEFTIKVALSKKRKILQVAHLHTAGVEQLTLYPLIETLPLFANKANAIAETASAEEAEKFLHTELVKAERAFKKKYDVHPPRSKKAAESQPEPQPEPEVEPDTDAEEEDNPNGKVSFKHYIAQAVTDLVEKRPEYKGIRVSLEIKTYLSDLLIEFIQRISGLVVLTTCSMKNKTVSDLAIMRTVKALLVDGYTPKESVEYREAMIPDPDIVKAETQKREDAKKIGEKYKVELSKIPKIKGLQAVRSVTYPGSGFDALNSKVMEKVATYVEQTKPKKEEAVEVK